MEKFVDAIGAIQVYGRMVRMDLMSVEAGQPGDKTNNLPMRRDGQLIMPLDGFLRAYAGMGQVMQELVKAGVVNVTPQAPGQTAPQASPATAKQA